MTMPVRDIVTTGVLTITYDDSSGDGSWDFAGTIAGAQSSASGDLTVEEASSGDAVSITVTSIDDWSVPFLEPAPPLAVTLRSTTDGVALSFDGPGTDLLGIPFVFNPPLTLPLDGEYTLADPGSVTEPDQEEELPRTGAGASEFEDGELASLLTVVGFVALTLAAILAVFRRSRVARW
jgi:hypothetical protein